MVGCNKLFPAAALTGALTTLTPALAETQPIAGAFVASAFAELAESLPKLTSNPPELGTMRYDCGEFKSTTIRVTGGAAENKLTRTPFTSARFTAIPRRVAAGIVFGMSITRRSGPEIICA